MASIEIRGVDKAFGATQVLHDVDLDVDDGEFVVLVGPSGCGKSTLLRMIAGLEEITAGEIAIGGLVVNDLPPKDRDIAMVFQNYALYPHMTVRENMAFSLRMRREDRAAVDRKVADAAGTLDLAAFLERFPRQLSGGQRQRVAMGRAIVRHPQVFLFDEPLSNLDAKLRVQMRVEIKALHQRLHATSIYVTHDQIEAMTMADRIVVLQDGRVEQIGTPLELYDRPANLFVAGFIGSPAMNFVRGRLHRDDGDAWVEALGGVRLPALRERAGSDGQEVVYSFRPEQVTLGAEGTGVPAKILLIEPTGAATHVYCELCGTQICAVFGERLSLKPGETLWLQPKGEVVQVFDSATGKVLH
ncbi:MAG TPA: sn-glycerol-3-phosphate ABC transporter ATP-binding protein UgpC [Casimicrobiaceae bacterium]|nr:sn-glycerol-3-phosphate ABC transporter ATP-binding protein UgpC [Casimicrobiaceae bacterium]